MYRPDIDGMRAFAVSFVILFHIWPMYLPGGFIGVDVFFVLSGYLITSIISSEMKKGEFKLREFYARRIKRILPVMWVVLASSLFISYFILIPIDLLSFVKSAKFTALNISNFYFSNKGAGYFSPEVNQYPLLHTWSLSAEEQFYFFWPLLLLLTHRFSITTWVRLITALSVFSISLFIACYFSDSDSLRFGWGSYGYYSIFSRSYELMLGAITAIIAQETRSITFLTQTKQKYYFGNLLAFAGVSMIVVALFRLNENTHFPSYYALLPTTGASLIILAGGVTHNSYLNKFLAKKYFVGIGLISYSMYLWHWPLLALTRYYHSSSIISIQYGIYLIIATLILSIFSYLCVEYPLKKVKLSFQKAFILLYAIPLLIILFGGFYIEHKQGFVDRVSRKGQLELQNWDRKYCHDSIKGSCIFGDLTAVPTRVLMFGDSHVGNYSPFWNEIAKKYGFSLKIVDVGLCYPLIDTIGHSPSSRKNFYNPELCRQQIKLISNSYQNYDLIIIAGQWNAYLAPADLGGINFDKEFLNTLSTFQQHNKKVIVMGDTPYDKNRDQILPFLRHSLLRGDDSNVVALRLNDNSLANDQIKVMSRKFNNVYYFDVVSDITSRIQSYPILNGFLVYLDPGHLNEVGSQKLADYYLDSPQSQVLYNLLESWSIIH